MLSLLDEHIHPGHQADALLQLLDVTALLWRLMLMDVPVGKRFERAADDWQRRLDEERGFYGFNDLHAMMAFAATGRREAEDRLLAYMRGAGNGDNVAMTRDVGLPLALGFRAFAQERWENAIDLIAPVRDIANRFGGSHAQRDVITLTLAEAARRGSRPRLARHVLAERAVHKPASALGWRLLARIPADASTPGTALKTAA